MPGTKRVRVVVYGHVQGVFFRETARRKAAAFGVVGWVRNRPEGSVEAVFEGEPRLVDELVAWCRRGPIGAEVDDVDTVEEPPKGDLHRFEVRW
jgi:acylphosphatase